MGHYLVLGAIAAVAIAACYLLGCITIDILDRPCGDTHCTEDHR